MKIDPSRLILLLLATNLEPLKTARAKCGTSGLSH